MGAPYETEALIVRSVRYRDHDKIVTLLTTGLGKRAAIAYGASRSTKRFAGALQPYQLIRVVLEPKRGRELLSLIEAEVVRAFSRIPVDPARHGLASYALELVRELTPEGDRDPRPVALLTQFLERLDAQGPSPSLFAAFLLNALVDAGFAPSLDRCAACARPAPPGRGGHFEAERGVVCEACGGTGPVLRGRVRQGLISASWWRELESCTEAELVSGVRLVCSFAHQHIGKEPKSWCLVMPYLAGWGSEAEG
jgi:DNA repair protein RecO (recombination protein O)